MNLLSTIFSVKRIVTVIAVFIQEAPQSLIVKCLTTQPVALDEIAARTILLLFTYAV